MAGLLSGVLPFLFSQGDRAKRRLGGLLSDPLGTAEQTAGGLLDAHREQQGLLAQALGNPQRPFQVTDRDAMMQAANNMLTGPLGFAPAGITAWHGSPHVFDKFDSSKIGTGEGAQAYGHGLYLAEAPAVANQYATALSDIKQLTPQGRAAQALQQADGDMLKARQLLYQQFNDAQSAPMQSAAMAAVEALNKGGVKAPNLYKVDLPDSAVARMLDWDKPLSQQAPEVQKALAKQYPEYFEKGWVDIASGSPAPNAKAYGLSDKELVNRGFAFGLPAEGNTAEMFYREISSRGVGDNAFQKSGHANASRNLRDLGIPGIRYLDGGSRGAGQGSSNFVVFPGEESILKILERNGVPMR